MPKSSQPLTEKQRAFVAQYLVDKNATKAAIRAGFSKKTASRIGSELLKKPAVKAAVRAALKSQFDRLELTADSVLLGLKRLAMFDIADAYDAETNTLKKIHDMPREVRDALAGVDVHHDGAEEPGFTVKLKLASRHDALVALGKYFKLFTEVVEHKVDGFADEMKEARARADRRE